MPRGKHVEPPRLWCGHEEYADGCCAHMACPNYYMKTGFWDEGDKQP